MARIRLLLLFLAVLTTLASASLASFCKCTCFQNSTIIPLGPQHDTPHHHHHQQNPPPQPPPLQPTPTQPPNHGTSPPKHWIFTRSTSTSCTQCNRAFCLQYNLPICKGAEAKDIKTDCFQRDSHKDRFIVWGFILGTGDFWGGLL